MNVVGLVSKFEDGTKIGGIVDREGGFLRLQQDLDQLGQCLLLQNQTASQEGWSFMTQMRSNVFCQNVVKLWNSLFKRAVEIQQLKIVNHYFSE